MKPFLFITDFDGTVTAQDFFQQILYRYEHDRIFDKSNKTGFDFLLEVFEEADLNEKEFEEEIKHIPLDPNFAFFCNYVEKFGGDVLILSAGSKYYIEKKLEFEGIKNVEILANGGFFSDGKFKFVKNSNDIFYCEDFGINKKNAVAHYRKKYEKIAYAGDTYVDFEACRLADYVFAKGDLAKILKIFKIDFNEFYNFKDVQEILSILCKI